MTSLRPQLFFLGFLAVLASCQGGQEAAPSEPSTSARPALPVPTDERLAVGHAVFVETCQRCHVRGLDDAPVVFDADAWAPRVAKGSDVLERHALEGFWGDVGEMPARGGEDELTDDQVRSAVQYLLFVQKSLNDLTPPAG